MRFSELVRRILSRGEVDDVHRDTEKMLGLQAESSDSAEQISQLRFVSSNDPHPDLSAAIKRRNAIR